MRPTILSAFAMSQLLCLSVGATALAEETTTTAPSATTTTTVPGTASSTTTVSSPTPSATSTTTTTQAAVDTTVAPAPLPRPPESGGSESTTYVNRPLLVTGLVLFGGTYAASAGVAAESARPSDKPNLYYPIVGPWLDLAQRNCTATSPCSGEAGNKALLVLDGVGQGVGVIGIITSFFVPEKKSRHWFFIGNEKLHATPSTIGSGYGATASGTF
jgi:hypothetical protein